MGITDKRPALRGLAMGLALLLCALGWFSLALPTALAAGSMAVVATSTTEALEQGGKVRVVVEVTNTGDSPLEDVYVVDPANQLVADVIEPGASARIELDTNVSDAQLGKAVPVTVSASGGVVGRGSFTVDRISRNPDLSFSTSVDKKTAEAGETVVFTYTVKNTGDVTLDSVSVTDSAFGTIGQVSALAVGDSKVFTYTHKMTGDITSSARADYTAGDKDGSKEASQVGVTLVSTGLEIKAEASETSLDKAGEVNFTVTVTNTGNQTLTNIGVSEQNIGKIDTIGSLAAGKSAKVSKKVEVSKTTTYAFTASGKDPSGKTVSASSAEVKVELDEQLVLGDGAITLIVTPDPEVLTQAGTVDFEIQVINNSDAQIKDVVISEKNLGKVRTIGNLAVGKETIHYTAEVNKDTDFTFVATAKDADGRSVEFTASTVSMRVRPDPSPSESPSPSPSVSPAPQGGSNPVSTLMTVLGIIIVLVIAAVVTLIILSVQEKKAKQARQKRRMSAMASRQDQYDEDDEDEEYEDEEYEDDEPETPDNVSFDTQPLDLQVNPRDRIGYSGSGADPMAQTQPVPVVQPRPVSQVPKAPIGYNEPVPPQYTQPIPVESVNQRTEQPAPAADSPAKPTIQKKKVYRLKKPE
ncbi:MAG: DUF7507 domain-containing protein [Christensenellales bacterium]|jgi:type II secretory pathway pseudopilin PulG